MNLDETPITSLFGALGRRLLSYIWWPVRCVRSLFRSTSALLEPTAPVAPLNSVTSDAPSEVHVIDPLSPQPTDVSEPAVPQKSELCLKLEGIADNLDAELVMVPPGHPQPGKYVILISSNGELVEKERKTCGIFSSFGTNKDLLSFLFGKNCMSQYKLYALNYPNWIGLSRIGEFKRNKVFRADNTETQDFYYIVSNCGYSKDFVTDSMVQQEQAERDNLAGSVTENVRAHNE